MRHQPLAEYDDVGVLAHVEPRLDLRLHVVVEPAQRARLVEEAGPGEHLQLPGRLVPGDRRVGPVDLGGYLDQVAGLERAGVLRAYRVGPVLLLADDQVLLADVVDVDELVLDRLQLALPVAERHRVLLAVRRRLELGYDFPIRRVVLRRIRLLNEVPVCIKPNDLLHSPAPAVHWHGLLDAFNAGVFMIVFVDYLYFGLFLEIRSFHVVLLSASELAFLGAFLGAVGVGQE